MTFGEKEKTRGKGIIAGKEGKEAAGGERRFVRLKPILPSRGTYDH
jgi:hypothetical protein